MIVKIFENDRNARMSHFYEVLNIRSQKQELYGSKQLPQGCIVIGEFTSENQEALVLNLVDATTRLPFVVVVTGRSSIYIMNNEAKTIEVIKLPSKNTTSME